VAVEQESTAAARLLTFELFLLHLLTFLQRSFVWTIIAFYTHPLLFVGLFFVVLQVRRSIPRIIVHHSSLIPFGEMEHENCSTTQTGVEAIPCVIQGAEGKKQAPSITLFLQRK
jgi:hypothetical protein